MHKPTISRRLFVILNTLVLSAITLLGIIPFIHFALDFVKLEYSGDGGRSEALARRLQPGCLPVFG